MGGGISGGGISGGGLSCTCKVVFSGILKYASAVRGRFFLFDELRALFPTGADFLDVIFSTFGNTKTDFRRDCGDFGEDLCEGEEASL